MYMRLQRLSETTTLALIALMGAALRAAAIMLFEHQPVSDEQVYLAQAKGLLEGETIRDPMGNLAMYNVGYAMFVLFPAFYLFGEDLLSARLANLLLGCLSIVLVYLVAREARAPRPARLLATAAWALYLPSSIYGVYLAKENLMIPLMLGVLWCALRIVHGTATVRVALSTGVLFGFLALVGNAALALGGSVALAIWFAPRGAMRKALYCALILGAGSVVATPWMLRNAEKLGAPVLNTNGGFNFYLGNNPNATGFFVSIADTPRGPSWNELRKIGEVEASATLKAEAIEWIKQEPAAFISLAARKIGYFWMPPFHDGQNQASAAEQVLRWMWAAQFIVLVLLALGGVFMRGGLDRSQAVLWAALVCYTLAHTLFYVIYRYREPVMPVLAILAAISLDALIRRRHTTRPNAVALS